MEARQKELAEIKSYIEGVDKEVTMLLQSLQWDRKLLLEGPPMVLCRYNAGHRVPPDKREEHEGACCLRSQGYLPEDILLPEPFDPDASSLVKFSKEDITKIIDNASKHDPLFKKGAGYSGPAPLSLERLQAAYTADERRALHDAAVSAAPACHDLTDLALISSTTDAKSSKQKSRTEVLAELRDMRRRRTKYRVAAKTRNYSDVLRDVIRTQMELYSGIQPSETDENTLSKTPNDRGQNYSTKDTKSKYAEQNDRPQNRHQNSNSHTRRFDEFTERDPSREHQNGRENHKTRYDKRGDRHEKHYTKDNRQYRDRDRHSRREKESSLSKERSRKDDKYERIVIKEEFDKNRQEFDRHSDYYESKRDKHSRSHKSYNYEKGSSSSSSKSKRRHKPDDYEDKEYYRHDNDRKRRRKEVSEKYSESQQSQYKRYYDTVEVKQERDSS